MKYSEILEITRRLRRNQTPEEKQLWEIIRNRKLQGKKFLRQHAIIYENIKNDFSFFIPDFYCSELKLAIELDGEIHKFQKEKDHNRELILNAKGLTVLRINNEELDTIERVKEKICAAFHPSLLAERGRG